MINKKILYTGILAGLILSLISCRNLFSPKNRTSEGNDVVIISGKISAKDIQVTPEYDTNDYPAISRYAIPDPDTILYSDVWYTITAYRGTKAVEGAVAVDPDYGFFTFSVPLSQGNWIIVARGYNNETTHNTTTQFLQGQSETIVIDGAQNKSKDEINIITEPILKGSGNVNLAITVGTSINTIIAEWQQPVSGTPTTLKQVLQRGDDFTNGQYSSYATAYFTMKDTPASGGTQVNQTSNGLTSVPAGIYDIKINFYKEDYDAILAAGTPIIPAYTVPKETVYVYQNIQTSVWHNKNNRIEVTNDLIDYSAIHTFCVKFASNLTTQDGSTDYPFKTLQAAIDKVISINDGGDYTIYLLDDFTESASTGSYSTSDGNKGTLVKIITQTDKPLNLTICSDSSFEKRTVNINRSSTNNGGIFYLNGSAANLNLTLEDLVLKGAYSEKTGGVIGMENATANSGTFTGARVSIKNCIIRDNSTKADSAGAIMVSKHNSLQAYKTTFYNNQTYHNDNHYSNAFGNGGAIYAYGGITIDTCVFDSNKTDNSSTAADNATENNAAGGAIMVNLHPDSTNDNLNVIIRNSTFVNNITKGAGGAIQINTPKSRPDGSSPADFPLVQFYNVVIKNNKSSNTSFAGGIGLRKDDSENYQELFSIKGINQITDNYCSDGAGGLKVCNVYLPEDKKINVTGNLSDSIIGITREDANTIPEGGGLAFTNGTTNIPVNPSSVFTSDNEDYAVDSSRTTSNEARIISKPSQSGALTPDYNFPKLDISLTRKKISYGNNTTVSVSVERNGSKLSADDVEMSYTLSSFGGEIEPESGNTPKYFSLDSSNPFKLYFHNELPKGNYELLVKAYDKKNGITSSSSYVIENITIPTLSDAITDGVTLAAGQVYAIKTPADFTALANKVNNAPRFNFDDVTLYLENDITLTGEVNVIGYYTDYPFKGRFNGQGHTITYGENDESVSLIGYATNLHASLFCCIEGAAVIEDVVLEGNVNGHSALIGRAYSNDNTHFPLIQNIKNNAEINFSSSNSIDCGGIICLLSAGTVKNCINTGSVTVSSSNNYATQSVGGICGSIYETETYNYSHIYNCKNTGNITFEGNSSSFAAGGILGGCLSASSPSGIIPAAIFNCENSGEINSYKYAGGIIGNNGNGSFNASMDIYNCINNGEVRYGEVNVYTHGYISGYAGRSGVTFKNNVNDHELYNNTYAAICIAASGVFENNYYRLTTSIPPKDNDKATAYTYSSNGTYLKRPNLLASLNQWVSENNENGLYKSWVLEDRDNDGEVEPHLDLGF